MCLLSEAALYALIMRSDKPAAAPFQLWVTGEVLPAAAARAWANEYEGRRTQEALRIAAQAEVEALKLAAAVCIFINPQTNRQDNVAYSELAAAKLRW